MKRGMEMILLIKGMSIVSFCQLIIGMVTKVENQQISLKMKNTGGHLTKDKIER